MYFSRRAATTSTPPLDDPASPGEGIPPGQYPFDIAVKNREVVAKGEDQNGPCRGATDAGQRRHLFDALWKEPVMGLNDLSCGTMEVSCTCIVTKARPQSEHFIQFGLGKIIEGGQCFEKAVEVGDHGGHLSLLEHDLRHPDPIRILGLLPGEVVAPPKVVPSDHPGCKLCP